MAVDMDMFSLFYFSDTGASRSFTIMLGFLMNQRTSERSQTITDPSLNFKNTNSRFGYRQTFQMCIMSRNDFSFFQ